MLTRFGLYALFLGTTLGVKRLLLFLRLFLEYVTLYIRPLASNLDVDST